MDKPILPKSPEDAKGYMSQYQSTNFRMMIAYSARIVMQNSLLAAIVPFDGQP